MRVTHVRDRLERVPAPVVDAVLAAATAVAIAIAIAARQEPDAKEPDAFAYLLGVAIAALLLARRRRPLAVFLASAALVIAYHALEYPAIGLVAPLAPALYTAARAGHFRPVVAVIVTLELFA
ncbi:MAG TPA: hypothetical protein VK874_09910, partial [Gaiellaceae bacterium]|nr:hypothetical protein [Gaiellaceae bacterium]